MKNPLRAVLITAAVLLFLYFVWPTPYEYMKDTPTMYRVNRFTGETWTNGDGSGWEPAGRR